MAAAGCSFISYSGVGTETAQCVEQWQKKERPGGTKISTMLFKLLTKLGFTTKPTQSVFTFAVC